MTAARRFASSAALLFLLTCTPVPQPAPEAVPRAAAQLAATAKAQRVVLISFDGLGADALAAQHGLSAFEHLAATGLTARVVPVDPTVTMTTHVSILTGADPQQHGIVSNRYHIAGRPPDETARGAFEDIDAETLVERARRQGKRVGAVLFPTIDARNARRTADFGLVWSDPLVPGRFVSLTRSDFHRQWVPPTWSNGAQRRRSFSPIMRARVEWGVPRKTRADVDIVAYDTTDDRTENYDAYFVEADERELPIDARGWFAIASRGDGVLYGSWSKLAHTTPSLDVTLYWGAVSTTNAYPAEYRAIVEEEAGFWPGIPDERAGVDAQTFAEQFERLADFCTRAQTAAIRRMPFDLLLAYQPQIDEAAHRYLGAPDGESVIRRAFIAADRAVGEIGALLDGSRDALIVTGDHGLVPTQREVRINRLLADGGLAPRWRAYVSGSVAHVYRFSGADDADAVVALLNASGFFERVEKKNAAMHRNSGDVIAYAQRNTELSASADAPAVVSTPSGGHHGALNTHRELHPAFFAAGAGVRRGDAVAIPQTSIAGFVAELLGF